MPRQNAQLLDYAPQRTARKRPVTLIELGVCIGIIAMTISLTFGNGEGRDGYVSYLYPLIVPLLNQIFGSHRAPPIVELAACLFYWPILGVAAHLVLVLYSRWRHRKITG
jgi:hypothetical protein